MAGRCSVFVALGILIWSWCVPSVLAQGAPPLPGEHVRLDPNEAPRLRWISLDGRPPGTYAEYLAEHPLRPAVFSHRQIVSPAPGNRNPDTGGLALLVNADLYPAIQPGLNQYLADLTADGYSVYVEAVSGGTPLEIKSWVANRYAAGDEGVVFIGDIAAAWAQWNDAVFPCDLFYMDVDGHWEDADGDGDYEIHTSGTGDEGPEVYVARMYTPTLSWDTEANMLNAYFSKVHDYRHGILTQPWRGLEYVDEPWAGYSYFLNLMYQQNIERRDFGHLTTGPDYLHELGQRYHYVQVCAHSGGSAHFFGLDATESCAYAHVYVHSPTSRSARLLMGSDDGIKVWLNGAVVCNRDFYWNWWETGWEADQFQTTIHLNPGWNRLLCKTSQRYGQFRFSVRLAHTDYQPMHDLLYQTSDPEVCGEDPHAEPGTHIGTWLMNGLYENEDASTRLRQDYLGGEADVRPSEDDPAPYGTWRRRTSNGCPVDLLLYHRGQYGPGGPATSANVQERDPQAFFFNLFACGSGRFTEQDYLGGSYIFNTSHGLITLASAKSGSMVNFELFNGPLGQGLSFGQAFFAWWDAMDPYPHDLRGWIYGMILSGDPTLCLMHDTQDCNNNGLPDPYDIAMGFSIDCNMNGRPDECDVAGGFAPDCNGNGVPDECDIFGGMSPDCNGNGIPDECDIASGTSPDADANGIPDECELFVRFVQADAPTGGDGLSWQTAYHDLQAAIADAAAMDPVTEIWVAAGSYTPAGPGGDRTATFRLVDGVAIYGGFAGDEASIQQRDPLANVTILSGDLNGDDGPGFANNHENSFHVITGSDCDTTAILDGFTVTGGNADSAGGAVLNVGGTPTFINCVVSGNAAPYSGGGMYNMDAAPTVINCAFYGNTANNGAAVHNLRSRAMFVNCLIADNVAGYSGGGVRNEDSSTTLINCTLYGNSAYVGGGVYNYWYISRNPRLANCILWGNTDAGGTDESAQIHTESGSPAINYCCIQGWSGSYGGIGNIGAEPLFVDPQAADYRLAVGSPCIDAGDNTRLPADEWDLDRDGDTTELLPLDFRGRPRRFDDPDTPDTGNGAAPLVDLGTCEFQGVLLPGDLNCNGAVDAFDIDPFVLAISDPAAYEALYPDCDINLADINGDGVIDAFDIDPFVELLTGP